MTNMEQGDPRTLRVGRLIVLVAVAAVLEWLAATLGPQLAGHSKNPHLGTLIITLVPLVWVIFFLAIAEGALERILAYVALIAACVVIYLVNGLSWQPLVRLLRPQW